MFPLFPLSPPGGKEEGRREAEAPRGGDTRGSHGPRGGGGENRENEVGAGVPNPRRTGLGDGWERSFCGENDGEHGEERLGPRARLTAFCLLYTSRHPSVRVLLVSGARLVFEFFLNTFARVWVTRVSDSLNRASKSQCELEHSKNAGTWGLVP